jgi:hypothetical protein
VIERVRRVIFFTGLLLTLACAVAWVRGFVATDEFLLKRTRPNGAALECGSIRLTLRARSLRLTWSELVVRRVVAPAAAPAAPPAWTVWHASQEPEPVRWFEDRHQAPWWVRLGFNWWTGSGFSVPLWFTFIICIAVTVAPLVDMLHAPRWRRAMLARRLCPACGYDLQGAAHERCPECGEPVGVAAV